LLQWLLTGGSKQLEMQEKLTLQAIGGNLMDAVALPR
jgi:hypothetical protein